MFLDKLAFLVADLEEGAKKKKVGQVGMVWFVLEDSKSRTVTQSVSYKGGYRAARAAQNICFLHLALGYWLRHRYTHFERKIIFSGLFCVC